MNHSYVDLAAVGNAEDGRNSVQCHTDLRTCCSSSEGYDRGDWFLPTGERLNFSKSRDNEYESRIAQQVHLRHHDNGKKSGIYHCTIETNAVHSNSMSDTTIRETVYVGLYYKGGESIFE